MKPENKRKSHKLNFAVSPDSEQNMQAIMSLTHRQRGDMIEEIAAFYLFAMVEMPDQYLQIRQRMLGHQVANNG
jgi:hypothetical protein